MKKVYWGFIGLLSLIILPSQACCDTFSPNASYAVCFTPGGDCTEQVVNAIKHSSSAIWVQAYSFTSRPIEKALVKAEQRGVNVQVILDKDVLNYNESLLNYFSSNNIPIWIDYLPTIAHNKVIIIDGKQIITGSFNFTYAAQNKNAENLLIINDAGLAQKYLQNWQERQKVAEVYTKDAQSNETLNDFWQWLLSWIEHWF